MDEKIAIVTTLRGAGKIVESFVRYHTTIGISCIYLFFDDPNDSSIAWVEKYKQVRVIRTNDALREAWTHSPNWKEQQQHCGTEVMSRQILNADVAIGFAREEGMDWLLHIDIDELFYVPQISIRDVFGELSRENVDCVTFWNYESVPALDETQDFFKTRRLFKKNPKLLSAGQREYYKQLPVFRQGIDYFWFYGNGKSAARIGTDTMSNGVHGFEPATHPQVSTNAFILHYPICTFEQFWNKYRDLGLFSDRWFERDEIPFRMHLQSRDIVNSGDKEAAREFYQQEVKAIMDLESDLLELEIIEEITFPSTTLGK